jgi:hypothetical protein
VIVLRALTLTQPWAGLVASGIKLIENRQRGLIRAECFGKRFAIHASGEIDPGIYDTISKIARQDPADSRVTWSLPDGSGPSPWYRLSRVTGAVIATAVIDRVVRVADVRGEGSEMTMDDVRDVFVNMGTVAREQARWLFGPVAYVLRDVRPLATPVRCRGWLSFFALPDDVATAVRAQTEVEC